MRSRGLQKYVEWLEWLLGTCEVSPRSRLGDKGRGRPAGLYFVHVTHFTRIQAAAGWRLSTSVPLLAASDSEPARGAGSLGGGTEGSRRPFVVLQATFGLDRGRCRRTHTHQGARSSQARPAWPRGWKLRSACGRRAALPHSPDTSTPPAALRIRPGNAAGPRLGGATVTICA